MDLEHLGRESQSHRGRDLESASCLSVCLDMDVGILHTDIYGVSARSGCWTQALLPQGEVDEDGVILGWEVCPVLWSHGEFSSCF